MPTDWDKERVGEHSLPDGIILAVAVGTLIWALVGLLMGY